MVLSGAWGFPDLFAKISLQTELTAKTPDTAVWGFSASGAWGLGPKRSRILCF